MTANRRMRLSAYGFVAARGAVLLTQLGDGEVEAGSWTLPGGGVDWGEHPVEALHRELYEETGLEGTVEGLLGINSHVFSAREDLGRPELHAVRLVYRVAASGEPRVIERNGSTTDAAWVEVDRLPTLPLVGLVVWALEKAGMGAS